MTCNLELEGVYEQDNHLPPDHISYCPIYIIVLSLIKVPNLFGTWDKKGLDDEVCLDVSSSLAGIESSGSLEFLGQLQQFYRRVLSRCLFVYLCLWSC
jgi:hypothetical protein